MVFGNAVSAAFPGQGTFLAEAFDIGLQAVGLQELGIYAAGGTEGQHQGFHLLVLYAQGFLGVRVAGNLVAVPAASASAERMGRRAQ